MSDDKQTIDQIIDAMPANMDHRRLGLLFICLAGMYGIEGQDAKRFFTKIADVSMQAQAEVHAGEAIERMKRGDQNSNQQK